MENLRHYPWSFSPSVDHATEAVHNLSCMFTTLFLNLAVTYETKAEVT